MSAAPELPPASTCFLRDVQLGAGVRYWSFVNLYGCSIGDDSRIGAFVEVQKGARIGARCKISSHTFVCEGVTIEDEVFVGHGVAFINDRYPRATTDGGAPQSEADWAVVPTHVGRRASIGSGATILCGVRIGEGALIGAGAVVTRDVPPGGVVAGNPARLLRRLAEEGGASGPPSAPPAPGAAVPAFDLSRQTQALRGELLAALGGVLDRCAFSGGPEVEAFERELAGLCGAGHAVGLSSGTAALHLALVACGVGPGDEVIVPPFTFAATAWAVSYVGARPVFVDVEPDTLCLDPTRVEAALTPRTRAVIPVHLYGQMADLEPLLALCRSRGLHLIEDAAQAQGATYLDRPAGSLGRLGCFSFYPSKNLGACGDAGAVVTDDPELAGRLRALRDHAQRERYLHEEVGFNYRLSGFQAATLRVKLRHLQAWNERRRAVARLYLAGLRGLADLRLPVEAPGRRHVWHQFVVRHPRRDALRAALEARGVGTGLHYPRPLHLQPAYVGLGLGEGSFPVAEAAAREVLSLPMFPELTLEEVDRVIEAVRACA